MNIFASDICPSKSAKALDDKRVVKMILETAQILATVIRKKDVLFANKRSLYKATHQNHPCILWAGLSAEHYAWTLKHFRALCAEYEIRFGKIHKSQKYYPDYVDFLQYLPKVKFFGFQNCTNFKEIKDTNAAYREALRQKWGQDKRAPKWTKTSPPDWYVLTS